MQYRQLSTTDTRVSLACLGTMSFGAHVDEATSRDVMSASLEMGINFFDTAEIYAIPPTPETYGDTERIIGRWMKATGTRDQIVLATKVAGPGNRVFWVRDGQACFDEDNIRAALEGSLQRLQTDYVDLYQLHWPDRLVPKFGARYYEHTPAEDGTELEETLTILQTLQKEGKIKHIGLSNETPWGTMQCLSLAREKGLPRVVSMQNNYSLLTRTFDVAMSEMCQRENIGLLAYSPLGFGALGGRYLDGTKPQGGRFTKYPDFNDRYRTPAVDAQTKRYKALAEANGMTLVDLALAFVYQHPALTSNIIGPSNVKQLEQCVQAADITLSSDILAEIDAIDADYPNPCA